MAGSGDDCVPPLEERLDCFQSTLVLKLTFASVGRFKRVLGGRGEGRPGMAYALRQVASVRTAGGLSA